MMRGVRLALVGNARSGTRTDVEEVAGLLRGHGATVDVYPLEDAERVDGGYDRVVVAGGDGSVGPAARAAVGLGVPLAVVATGTANDFARALELPLDRERAAALAAAAAPARLRRLDLARCGDRPFVNAASAGLSVLAARQAVPLKARLGAIAYLAGAARAGVSGSPLPITVTADGEPAFDGSAWQVTVGATGAFGGGSEIGGVRHGDGELDAAIVPGGSRVGLARRAIAMRLGRLTSQRGVRHVRGRVIEVDVPPGTRFNVDGEVCRLAGARFEVDATGLEVVVPA